MDHISDISINANSASGVCQCWITTTREWAPPGHSIADTDVGRVWITAGCSGEQGAWGESAGRIGSLATEPCRI
eukprot:12554955-Alexandrium_andersonii.AAC.1